MKIDFQLPLQNVTTGFVVSYSPISQTWGYTAGGGGGGSPNLTWGNAPSGTVNPMVAGAGYFTTDAGVSIFTLPVAAPTLGEYFAVAGVVGTGWEIHQNANQQILYASTPTQVGTGGKVASGSSPQNGITLVYAGVIGGVMTWTTVASVGALTITQ